MPLASDALRAAFAVLAVLVAGGFVAGVHRSAVAGGASRAEARRTTLRWAAAVAGWMAVTGIAAASGRLRFDTMPPTMMLLVVVVFVASFAIGLSRTGDRLALGLPLALLVGFQVFRLPLELLMHRAYEEGVMPVQMSFSGYNFDILTGVLALPVAALLATGQLPLWVARAWNVMGALLLANVLAIALMSTPTPLRMFHNEPANLWVTQAPFVWLPAVLVPAALIGHVVIFRRLGRERS
ncbi:MAG TPA: hypothetical protein VMN78_07815 [Longimicrobiales bacterium]|nr:hypothetical protein [Longimicrobiales bacterium]